MKKKFLLFICLFCILSFQMVQAALYKIDISAEITSNQSNTVTKLCGIQGFSACPYFPLMDIIKMTMIYDDSTLADSHYQAINTLNTSTYANPFTSISFSNSLFTSTYSNNAGFGQFQVTNMSGSSNDRLAIRLWDSSPNTGFPGSASSMHLTPIDTSIANPNDNVYGNIEIKSILINLAGLDDLLISSKSLPTRLSISDLDLTKSNLGVNLRTLGTNPLTVGWAGSAGAAITAVSISAISVPEPSVIVLMLIGIAGISISTCRKKA